MLTQVYEFQRCPAKTLATHRFLYVTYLCFTFKIFHNVALESAQKCWKACCSDVRNEDAKSSYHFFFFIFQKLHFHKKQVIGESGTMWRSESSSDLAKTRNNTADCSANGPFICSCDSVLLVLQLTSYCAAVRRAVMKYHSIAANSILP